MSSNNTKPVSVVTGGAGFLGSHLTDRLLKEGHRVIAVDNLITGNVANIEHLAGNKDYKFINHDVTDFIYIPGQVDYVWHFASPASPIDYLRIPIPTLKVGSLGTHNALGLAKDKGAAFFLASTSECYGDPLIHPQTEDYWGNVNPIGPRSCYDEGKRCAETLFFDYHRQYRTNIKVARIFNTYGPRMHPNDGRVVSNFIVQALRGDPITIYGDGKQTRSFCFVSDLVEGLRRLMDSPDEITGPINLGNPGEFTMMELAEAVIRLTGSTSRPVFRQAPVDDPRQRQPDITKARGKLGWEPTVALEQGLIQTIAYFDRLLSKGAA
jgi:nucleoside-diphosphate-sugar epimerase